MKVFAATISVVKATYQTRHHVSVQEYISDTQPGSEEPNLGKFYESSYLWSGTVVSKWENSEVWVRYDKELPELQFYGILSRWYGIKVDFNRKSEIKMLPSDKDKGFRFVACIQGVEKFRYLFTLKSLDKNVIVELKGLEELIEDIQSESDEQSDITVRDQGEITEEDDEGDSERSEVPAIICIPSTEANESLAAAGDVAIEQTEGNTTSDSVQSNNNIDDEHRIVAAQPGSAWNASKGKSSAQNIFDAENDTKRQGPKSDAITSSWDCKLAIPDRRTKFITYSLGGRIGVELFPEGTLSKITFRFIEHYLPRHKIWACAIRDRS